MNKTRGRAYLVDTRTLRVGEGQAVVMNNGCVHISDGVNPSEEIMLPKGSVIQFKEGKMMETGGLEIIPLKNIPAPTLGKWVKELKSPQPEFTEMAKPIMEAAARAAMKVPPIEI